MAIKRVGLIQEVLEDKRVQKYKLNLAKLRKMDQSRAHLEEMKQMHAARWERKALAKKVLQDSQRILIDMVMRNQSYRSRVAEIQMDTFQMHAQALDHTKAIVKYVIAMHSSAITHAVDGSRTKADREGYVESLFPSEMRFVSRLATVLKITSILIEDLDQAGWAVQRSTAVLQILQGKGAVARI